MQKLWNERAWEDYKEWLNLDKKIVKKINEIIKDIKRNGNEGIGKPEPLKHELNGYWSRRITDKHRFIYKLTETAIVVIACANHYE